MNVDSRQLFARGERAATTGRIATARACFLEAGAAAASLQLWRSAVRCYRHALELDLLDRSTIRKLAKLPASPEHARAWAEYLEVVERDEQWLSFGCRDASVVVTSRGSFVDCPRIGPVIDLVMPTSQLALARPIRRFAGMPLAMAMIILRRAMFGEPTSTETTMKIDVAFDETHHVTLDQLGDWTTRVS